MFADSIREKRFEAKLRQGELASLVGVRRQTIYNWEHGVYLPPRTKLRQLAKALRITMEEISRIRDELDFTRRSDRFQARMGRMPTAILAAAERQMSVTALPVIETARDGDPARAVALGSRWKGKRCFVSLSPGFERLFAFRLPDKSMEPKLRRGDLIFADSKKPPETGRLAVFKLKAGAPVCRLYEEREGVKILLSLNSTYPERLVGSNEVEWGYQAILKL